SSDDRLLFTHLGRWPKMADPGTAKYKMCSVRDRRWHLVSDTGGSTPSWKLFDVASDYGETTDVIAQHPEIAARLRQAYDRWWDDVQPMLVNERAVGPRFNPFKERFWRQFGGEPSAEDLRLMDPQRSFDPPRGKAKGGKQKKQKA
ncbi:MAG: hypothetical protein AB7O38_30520, partial [Pirellulaceae bacterium]